MLLVEQHVHRALEIADRAYVLRRGRVELSGAAAELRTRMSEVQDSYLTVRAGEANGQPSTPTSTSTTS